ncbi:hypothetical protein [Ferruginibacter sp.]
MKKLSFVFDVIVISALYSNIFPERSIYQAGFWGMVLLIMTVAAITATIRRRRYKKSRPDII